MVILGMSSRGAVGGEWGGGIFPSVEDVGDVEMTIACVSGGELYFYRRRWYGVLRTEYSVQSISPQTPCLHYLLVLFSPSFFSFSFLSGKSMLQQ